MRSRFLVRDLPRVAVSLIPFSTKDRIGRLRWFEKIHGNSNQGRREFGCDSLLEWMQEMPAPLSFISPMECLELDKIPG
jgi:hypothetical protein